MTDYDPHRFNPNVHYRLFRTFPNGEPGVICMQDFDYDVDFDPSRLLSPDAWDTEQEAEEALKALMGVRVMDAMETMKWMQAR